MSDLHIGDPRVEDEDIVLSVLKRERYDQIVLNGDIIELWFNKPDDIRGKKVIRKLSEIAKDKKVVWVLGNHDWDARGHNIIPGAIETDSFEVSEHRRKILCIHGHQVYEFQNMSWHAKMSTRVNYWVWKKTGINLQRFFQTGPFYKWIVKNRRRKILEIYGKMANTIVIGHTHLVGYDRFNGSELYDIGSLALRKTYAIIENGWVELRKAVKEK